MSTAHSTAGLAEAEMVESSPLGGNWQKLMMWAFVVTDALLFAGLLTGYGFVRLAGPEWPHQAEIFYLPLIAFMTFVLISSSATMAAAVGASREGDSSRVSRFLLLTLLGGIVFLGLQAYEWATFIGDGATLTSNPWGVPLFSASFFLITGFHGSHVLTGLIILATVLVRTKASKSTPTGIESAGLYWHFVDLAWVFIFTLFYLI